MNVTTDKYWTHAVCLALTIIVLAVFWQVNNFEFINYDDKAYVSKNEHIYSGFTSNNIKWLFTKDVGRWHPLTGFTHMLDCELFGLNPGKHHLTNLLFHIANTLLLFVVFNRATGALWKSAFVAALFAIHPLHVESVAWISGRKDLLSALFWILTIDAYCRYVKRRGLGWYALALIFFALGLMAKPMITTLPFVLLLLDYWPLNRLQTDEVDKIKRQICRKLIFEKVPFFVVSAASCVVTFFLFKNTGQVRSIEDFPLTIRAGTAVISYVKYIIKMIWPRHLAVYYPYLDNIMPDWLIIVAGALLLVFTIQVIRFGKKYKYLPVGWFMFLGMLVPVIGLIQISDQAMADRYTYLSFTGLFIIVAWGAGDMIGEGKYQKILLAMLSLAAMFVLSVCAWFQVGYWCDSITLFKHALKVTSNNCVAHYAIANSLYEQGKTEEAMAHDYEALRIAGSPAAHVDLGIALAKQGKLDEAIIHFNEVLRISPKSAEIHRLLGKAFLEMGKLDEAANHYGRACQIEPLDSEAYNGLGVVLSAQSRYNEAIAQFDEALRIKPDFADAHGNLGFTLLNQHKVDEAISHLNRAVQLDPNSDKSQYYLAIALGEKGKTSEAVMHYEKSLQLKPNWVEPMNTLAWLLATHKNAAFYNPQKALHLAQHACRLTADKDAEKLDTLAVAYAAAGNFAEAIKTAEKALQLAQMRQQKELAEQISNRLQLYKNSKSYSENCTLPIH